MRELEFRAWDGKKMCYNEEVWLRDDSWWYGLPGYDAPPDKAYSGNKETAIMQYIGLKDKNGEKIYEGDLCRDSSGVSRVVWNDKFASFCLCRKGWLSSHFFGEAIDPKDIEVIGNIYENPEIASGGNEAVAALSLLDAARGLSQKA